MGSLQGFQRPIIAALGDISPAIDLRLMEGLCRNFADSATIALLGHRISDIVLPVEVIWIPGDPISDLKENLLVADVIICPYTGSAWIDERVFRNKVEAPIISYWPIAGQTAHVVDTREEFISAVRSALTSLQTEGRDSQHRPPSSMGVEDKIRSACQKYLIMPERVEYTPEGNLVEIELDPFGISIQQAIRIGEILGGLGLEREIAFEFDGQLLVLRGRPK